MEDLDEHTNTKQKNRTVGLGSYEEQQFQDKNSKKGKSLDIRKLSEKEAKILKVAEVCGAGTKYIWMPCHKWMWE